MLLLSSVTYVLITINNNINTYVQLPLAYLRALSPQKNSVKIREIVKIREVLNILTVMAVF